MPRSVYVISLPNRSDRRRAMGRELAKIGWSAEFFPAIRPKSASGFPSIGAHGCFLSHLSVLKHAHNRGAAELIILEDDVNFSPEFISRWSTAISDLEDREWSIFFAGHRLRELPSGLSKLEPQKVVQCAHFLAINGSAIPPLIEGLEAILSRPAGHPQGGPMHVDGAYSTIRAQNPSLVTYAYFPPLGYQRPSRTDIGDLKWFDRIEFLKPLIDVGRRLKATRRG